MGLTVISGGPAAFAMLGPFFPALVVNLTCFQIDDRGRKRMREGRQRNGERDAQEAPR